MKENEKEKEQYLIEIAKLRAKISELEKVEKDRDAAYQKLRAVNRQLDASNQQLRAIEQQLRATNQQLDASNQQLRAVEQQLRATNQQLDASNQQLRAKEHQLIATIRELRVWLKELNCLYRFSGMVEEEGDDLHAICTRLTDLLKISWQYPEITEVRINMPGKKYETDHFRETKWRLSAPVVIKGQEKGSVEIVYTEEKPQEDEGPFLKEERKLINTVAERLGKIIKRIQTEKALQESEQEIRKKEAQLKHIVDSDTDAMVIIDEKGTIVFANPAAEALWERKKSELIGFPFEYSPEKEKQEIDILRKNGEPVIGEMYCVPITWENKQAYLASVRDITERKEAEKKIKRNLEFQELITEISSGFVGIYNLNDTINKLLERTGMFCGASRSYLFLLKDDNMMLENTHEWCAPGVPPQIEDLKNLPVESIPWWMSKLNNNEPVHVPDVAALPKEAKVDKEILEIKNIKSVIVFPLNIENKLIGFIGFDNVEETYTWTDEANQVLQITSDILSNALKSKKADEEIRTLNRELEERVRERTAELQQSEAKHKEAQRIAHIGHWELDLTANKLYWSDEVYRIFNIQPEQFNGTYEAFLDLVHPDDRDMVDKAFTSSVKNHTPYDLTYRLKLNDGQIKYVHVLGETFYNDAGQPVRAIGTGQDITEIIRKEQEIIRYNKELALFKELNDVILSQTEKDKITDHVLRIFREMCSAENIMLFKYNDNTKDLHPVAIKFDNTFFDHLQKLMGENIIRYTPDISKNNAYSKCLKEGRSFVTEGTDNIVELLKNWTFPDSVHKFIKPGLRFRSINSIGTVPLVTGSTTWGLITFVTKEAVTDKYLDRLDRFARQASLALVKIENEKKLEISESRYRSLIANIPDVTWSVDEEDQIIFVSPNVEKILGYTPGVFYKSGLNFFSRQIHPDDIDQIRRGFKKLFTTGMPVKIEGRFRKADGKWIWVLVRSTGIYTKDGKKYADGIISDVTGRKKAEETIREERDLFQTFINALPDSIFFKDDQHRFVRVNKAKAREQNIVPGQMIGKTDFDFFPPEIARKSYDDDEYVLKSGEPIISRNEKIKYADGSIHWVSVTKLPRRNAEGKIIGTMGIARDITGSKIAEEEIRKLNQAVEQSPASIVITDTEGNIEYVNPRFTQVTGYTFEEALGKNPRILQSGETSQEVYKEMWDTISAGETWHGELLNKKKNGELFWESALISPINNPDGEIDKYLAVKEDITERKKMILDLIEAKEKAEESDRLKSAFLTNISHEIRTPMNGILGFTNLLEDPELTENERKEFIEIIKISGDRMLDTVNNLISVSKIETGQEKLYISEINVNEQIEELYRFFEQAAKKKGIKLSFENALPAQRVRIKTDKTKFVSVLTNLVNNAIKYTDKGSVAFGYRRKDECLEFFVKDTGIGIPESRQKAVFERFVQSDMALSSAYEGSGLGLSIAKSYVEMLGGKIWLESVEGEGSRFYFTLPYNTADKEITSNKDTAPGEKPESRLRDLKILVAEDDETSRIYLKRILQDFSSDIIYAKTGIEAVELCRSHPDIDLVLMDIKMPKLDGYEASRKIREFNKEIVILAQTAFAMAGDKEKSIEAGCDDYIAKPVQKDDLIEMISKFQISK